MLARLATYAGFALRRMAGICALACVFAGVLILFGIGWALLALAPFLILIDRSIP